MNHLIPLLTWRNKNELKTKVKRLFFSLRISPFMLFLLGAISTPEMVAGQRNYDNNPATYFTFYALGAQTEVDGLPEVIIPDYFDQATYTIEERKNKAIGGGIGLKVMPPESNFFFRGDLNLLLRQRANAYLDGGDYHYSDIEGLEYRVWLDYHRVSLAAQAGFHIIGHDEGSLISLYVAIGGAFSPMLRRRINYHSNRPDRLYHDLQTQGKFEQFLLLRNDLAALGTIGLEIGSGYNKFDLSFQYQLGASDIVETLGGNHKLVEYPENKTKFLQISLGYLIKWQQ